MRRNRRHKCVIRCNVSHSLILVEANQLSAKNEYYISLCKRWWGETSATLKCAIGLYDVVEQDKISGSNFVQHSGDIARVSGDLKVNRTSYDRLPLFSFPTQPQVSWKLDFPVLNGFGYQKKLQSILNVAADFIKSWRKKKLILAHKWEWLRHLMVLW